MKKSANQNYMTIPQQIREYKRIQRLRLEAETLPPLEYALRRLKEIRASMDPIHTSYTLFGRNGSIFHFTDYKQTGESK